MSDFVAEEVNAMDDHPFAKEEKKVSTDDSVGAMSKEEFKNMLIEGIVLGMQIANEEKAKLESRDKEVETEDEGSPHENGVKKAMTFVGNTLHGVVDVSEGLLRGTIDAITMGAAKR